MVWGSLLVDWLEALPERRHVVEERMRAARREGIPLDWGGVATDTESETDDDVTVLPDGMDDDTVSEVWGEEPEVELPPSPACDEPEAEPSVDKVPFDDYVDPVTRKAWRFVPQTGEWYWL